MSFAAGWLSVAAGAGLWLTVSHASAQPFSTPVGCDECINFWYYVDHGGVTDYDCGSATYADHNGSDYSLRGGNQSIDDGNVDRFALKLPVRRCDLVSEGHSKSGSSEKVGQQLQVARVFCGSDEEDMNSCVHDAGGS